MLDLSPLDFTTCKYMYSHFLVVLLLLFNFLVLDYFYSGKRLCAKAHSIQQLMSNMTGTDNGTDIVPFIIKPS